VKLAVVSPAWFPVHTGGIAVSCYQFCRRLEEDGHDVTLLVPKQKEVDHKGLNVVEVPLLGNMLGRNPLVWGFLSRLKRAAKEADVIVLYSYMYEMNARVGLYKKLGLIKKPLVLMYRGGLESELGAKVSLALRAGKAVFDATYGRMLFKTADRIVSNSKPTVNLIHDKYGVQAKKIAYVKNAVDTAQFNPKKKRKKRIVFVGRLVDNKGVHVFPDILKVVPKDWEFCVVGDGPLGDYVKSLAKEFPQLNHVGSREYKEVIELLETSSILVLPTFAEGSPRVVLEAAAAGTPSVAFNVGDVENVIPKGTGYVIDRFDIAQFCEKVAQLIENKKMREEFGASARKFAEEELDWSVVYPKMIEEVRQVVRHTRV